MEKKTIWHKYNRLEYPGHKRTILWLDSKNNCFVCQPDKEDWAVGCYDFIKEWTYTKDLVSASKALEELEAEYNEFICNTWVEYADEPDNKLTDDARKLRDRMRRLMNQKILSERDQYKKALDVAIESLTKIWKQPEDMADARDAEDTLKKISEIMKG